MQDAVHASPGRRGIAVLGIVGLLAWAVLALQVLLQTAWVTGIDPAVSAWVADHRTPVVTGVLSVLTQVHSTIGIDAMLALAVAVLAWRDRWRDAAWLAVAVQSSMLLNVLLKHAFARPRPALHAALVHLETFSFPSGHALAATVFWGCLVLLLPRAWRWPAAVGAAVLVVLIAASRVYLGAHYLSDVLAGIGEGLACVAGWRLLRAEADPWPVTAG